MQTKSHIIKISTLPINEIQPLIQKSTQEGFEFVERLSIEFQEGINQFNKPGEALFAAYAHTDLIAIGGLNQDPYVQKQKTGRVRHLYVLPDFRRQGIGKQIMMLIISEAKKHFHLLTLRTFNPDADKFYRHLGFKTQPAIQHTSHHMTLTD